MLRAQDIRWFLAVGALFLMVSVIRSQGMPTRSLPVTVHGQVRYAKTAAPVEGALVRLEKFSGGVEGEVVTDRTGKFQFSGMPPAQYLLKVHFPGYRDEQRQVDLQTTTSEYVLFQVLPEAERTSTPVARASLIDANVPPAAQKEFDKAEEAFSRERKEEGIKHLEKALALYPAFVEASLKLGTSYMDLAKWDKAEEVLNRALETNPAVPNVLFALGELNFQRGRYKEAESYLNNGLKIENRSWQGHFTLGRLYWKEGELVKAAKQVALTLQLNPRFAEAHLLGGTILLRAGKHDDALAEFEEYLRLAPNGEYSDQVRQTIEKIKTARPLKK